jgi:DNA-binding response OmpR family regulator
MNLLLVEDDAVYGPALAEELRRLDHAVALAPDGRQALLAVDRDDYDAVILDRMLPGLDGMAFLERLRGNNNVLPVIMLTALGQTQDKIEGLEVGADDYLVKPVPVEELNARLAAVARRRGWSATGSEAIRAGDLLVSPSKHRAWYRDVAIDLGKTEFKLLAELARNVDAVLTRSMLIERVWGYDFEPEHNLVDVYIRRLRQRLAAAGGDDLVVTVRGVGYMLKG